MRGHLWNPHNASSPYKVPMILWFPMESSQSCCPLQGPHNLVVPYGVPILPYRFPQPCHHLWSPHIPYDTSQTLLSPMEYVCPL